jgi:asparagine synthase (glutamine-hydrolysing)
VFKFGGRYYPKSDYLPQVFRARTLLSNLAQEIGDAYFTSMTAFRDDGLTRILSPSLRNELACYSPREEYRRRFKEVSHLPPLQQMQAVDFETYLPGDILVKADRATMAYSLESRSPWLDYRLAELAGRLPSEYKLHGRIGKHVFKQAVAPHVPQTAITRPKMGFAVPLAEWFRSSLKDVFRSEVTTAGMGDYVSTAEARRLLTEHVVGVSDHSRKLWNLLMLSRWISNHQAAPSRETAEVYPAVPGSL